MKKKIAPYLILTFLTIIMILLVTPNNYLFGSNTDWLSQHIYNAQTIRQTIIENKSLFPDFSFNLGAGINIYNISYYGLFRLDLLISCLFPSIEMKDIVLCYSIISLILSVNLTYSWLKNKNFNTLLCLVGSTLLLSSSVLFHSHRQIMFVDYMPWLILGLIAIDNYIKTNRNRLITFCVIMIITSSYYYSICALVVMVIYYCIETINNNRTLTIRKLLLFIKPIILGILICAVLLIPTAYVMLENHESKATGLKLISLLVPDLSFKSLLYSPYGCGLSYIAWCGIVLGLKSNKIRKLSILLLVVLIMPLCSFVLNGFLYARCKILIPFIPLIIYVVISVLKEYKETELKISWYYILLLLPVMVYYNKPLLIIDVLVCLIFIIGYLNYNKYLLIPLMIVPLVISLNQSEIFISKKVYQEVNDLSKLTINNDGRFDIFKYPFNSANVSTNPRTSIYSSINNPLYNHFCYDIMNNPISIRNRVALLSNSNIFFQGMMGVKTIYSEKVVPIGYQPIDNNLYVNDNVMPLIYASNKSYKQDDFEQLSFPNTLDTIYNNVIVKDSDSNYESKINLYDLNILDSKKSNKLVIDKINNGYHVNTNKNRKLELTLSPLDNQVLIIEFDIDNVKLEKTNDTSISINGIKNKLSSVNAPYPNDNNHFTYIISENDLLDKLVIKFSKGQYDLKNIKTYVMNYDVIKNRKDEVDSFEGKINKNGVLADGNINVSSDGYLVTSLPYQSGYHVYIDGKEVDYECVNKAFVGSKISSGYHNLKITFEAPYKNVSCIVSGLGILLFIFQGKGKKYEKRVKRSN